MPRQKNIAADARAAGISSEARRKAVYASFTKTPKHKKTYLAVQETKDQHKESDYLKIIQRYGSGDVQHAQSHDLETLKDWVETLKHMALTLAWRLQLHTTISRKGRFQTTYGGACFNSTLRING